jgi:DNA-binding MarR family transcriptional regulator
LDPAEQLYLAIEHAGGRFRALDVQLGLSPARFSLMAALCHHGPQRVGELAEREGVSQPTISRLVTTLEREGLVARRADEADRRGSFTELTPAGRALVRWARARKIAWVGAALRAESESCALSRRAIDPGSRRNRDRFVIGPQTGLRLRDLY